MAIIIALFILIIHNSGTLRFSPLEVLQIVSAVASRAAFDLRRKDYIRMLDQRQSSRIAFLLHALLERYAITSLLDTPSKDAAMNL